MSLRFVRHRRPADPQALSALEQTQVEHAGSLYDGEALPIARRLRPPVPGARFDDLKSFHGFLHGWDVVDDNGQQYTAWLYAGDSGTIFRAGTTEVVAEVIQGHLDHCTDPAIRAALQAAIDAHPRDSSVPRLRIARTRSAD